ncbi:hypothetical protein, partial [Nostoc sp. 'Peltigera membranacea cyanobiont' 213]|uniref:hypothetical protein n=1 Tax=Nostoc sp. 'Peltigera membranacea cyanobiont' 213 TaxID=2014530 RepID=UPI001CB8B5B6
CWNSFAIYILAVFDPYFFKLCEKSGYTGIRHESGQVSFFTKACSGFLLDNSSRNFSTQQTFSGCQRLLT